MASTQDSSDTAPLVLIHCLPRFNISFTHWLRPRIYPLEPSDPSYATLASSSQVLLTVGPTPVPLTGSRRWSAWWGPAPASITSISPRRQGHQRRRGVFRRRRGLRDRAAHRRAPQALRREPVHPGRAVARNGRVPVGLQGKGSLKKQKMKERLGGKTSWDRRAWKYWLSDCYKARGLLMCHRLQLEEEEGICSISLLCKSSSDALIICCTLSNETHHIINKDVMTALGKKGVIVNVGRGALVDEKELVQFLVRNEIGGAGLDVFENEPVVPEELYALDSVVLSPHKAVATPESLAAVKEVIIDNLEAFFSNKPLLSQVKSE
ncbi:hypothetical protein RJ639_011339 [Escallonia herrerae]|uniref:D-isomer specific 2-hydroxyacid dehydrogenase NAD-binding domain-containing protein n=1 Tax=Escallonia herrerae TaxID=1293975 RepID=A0AA88VK91_9ASTE|nr:hypothetical protein RJ639_011339 [Escallonia herrerae]